ncbi:hypothetical protein ACFVOR_36955 [Streptomyces sp. NPDC057837]|uniref:hypothetical protein n=1 Tax=Streptomyces sp. NPDC057837 TaxID=3346260 RepID=UPI00367618A5
MALDPYEKRAAMHKAMVIRLRMAAAAHELAATTAITERSMRQFVDTWNSSVAREVAEHPDLAELNVQLDGYYENPGKR